MHSRPCAWHRRTNGNPRCLGAAGVSCVVGGRAGRASAADGRAGRRWACGPWTGVDGRAASATAHGLPACGLRACVLSSALRRGPRTGVRTASVRAAGRTPSQAYAPPCSLRGAQPSVFCPLFGQTPPCNAFASGKLLVCVTAGRTPAKADGTAARTGPRRRARRK